MTVCVFRGVILVAISNRKKPPGLRFRLLPPRPLLFAAGDERQLDADDRRARARRGSPPAAVGQPLGYSPPRACWHDDDEEAAAAAAAARNEEANVQGMPAEAEAGEKRGARAVERPTERTSRTWAAPMMRALPSGRAHPLLLLLCGGGSSSAYRQVMHGGACGRHCRCRPLIGVPQRFVLFARAVGGSFETRAEPFHQRAGFAAVPSVHRPRRSNLPTRSSVDECCCSGSSNAASLRACTSLRCQPWRRFHSSRSPRFSGVFQSTSRTRASHRRHPSSEIDGSINGHVPGIGIHGRHVLESKDEFIFGQKNF